MSTKAFRMSGKVETPIVVSTVSKVTGVEPAMFGHFYDDDSHRFEGLSGSGAGNELAQFAQPQDRTGDRKAAQPITPAQTHRRKGILKERHVNHPDMECEREGDRAPEPRVMI